MKPINKKSFALWSLLTSFCQSNPLLIIPCPTSCFCPKKRETKSGLITCQGPQGRTSGFMENHSIQRHTLKMTRIASSCAASPVTLSLPRLFLQDRNLFYKRFSVSCGRGVFSIRVPIHPGAAALSPTKRALTFLGFPYVIPQSFYRNIGGNKLPGCIMRFGSRILLNFATRLR
jgi:hypothetical protein